MLRQALNLFFSKELFLIMYIYVHLYVGLYTSECRFLQNPQAGVGYLGARITGTLTIELSIQPGLELSYLPVLGLLIAGLTGTGMANMPGFCLETFFFCYKESLTYLGLASNLNYILRDPH